MADLVSHGDGRSDAGNGLITNDVMFYAYRITIAADGKVVLFAWASWGVLRCYWKFDFCSSLFAEADSTSCRSLKLTEITRFKTRLLMRILLRLSIPFLGVPLALAQVRPESLIFSGNYQNGAFESLTFVNSVVGWDGFFNAGFRGGSTVIGNIEAGHVWFGHEVFNRSAATANRFHTHDNLAAGSLDEMDYHATTVGHVLAGSGFILPNSNTFAGLGMAPAATLVSGAVATNFSSTVLGSFSVTSASVVSVYEDFFRGNGLGTGVDRLDVINSSWGGGDPAGKSNETLAMDGLARQNASVAHVVSAGNNAGGLASAPAAGFNNISVGSLGGPSFLRPSAFTATGMADFHNPVTGVTHTGVRVAVDIAAPGERLFLSAYLGDSGSIGASSTLAGLVVEPSPTDQYFFNLDGTSYASPIVAGGIALLKDVAKTDIFLNHNGNVAAFDTRVVKSVIMAGARETIGWDNGQNSFNVTTQALDAAAGAGSLDLEAAADVYFFGSRDVLGAGGGVIAEVGWDAGTINLGGVLEYVFAAEFSQEMTLNVALNWFSVRGYDDLAGGGADLAFSNLNLQVWQLDSDGGFVAQVGASESVYNNTEFLRIASIAPGSYGLRVLHQGMVFNTGETADAEAFGLAWRAVAIPEPTLLGLSGLGGLLFLKRRRA